MVAPFFHVSLNHNPPGCRNADIPHRHEYDEMLLCTQGGGGQVCEHQTVDMRAGDLFYFPAGMRHCSAFYRGCEFDCYVVDLETTMFAPAVPGDKEMLEVIASMGACGGLVPLSPAGAERILAILAGLIDEFHEKQSAYHAVAKARVMDLLITVARDPDFRPLLGTAAGAPDGRELINQVLAYVDGFYMNSITVDSVLKFCPLSRSRFHALFREYSGCTLVQYLTKRRIEAAKGMLRQTDIPVAQIGFEVGFNSPNYFNNVFRRYVGVAPGGFRDTGRS